jgi:hypothetical protein
MSKPVVKPEARDVTGSKHPFGVAVSDTPEILMRFGPIHYDGLPSPVRKPGSELFPVAPDFNPPRLHVVRAGFLDRKGGPKRPAATHAASAEYLQTSPVCNMANIARIR